MGRKAISSTESVAIAAGSLWRCSSGSGGLSGTDRRRVLRHGDCPGGVGLERYSSAVPGFEHWFFREPPFAGRWPSLPGEGITANDARTALAYPSGSCSWRSWPCLSEPSSFLQSSETVAVRTAVERPCGGGSRSDRA